MEVGLCGSKQRTKNYFASVVDRDRAATRTCNRNQEAEGRRLEQLQSRWSNRGVSSRLSGESAKRLANRFECLTHLKLPSLLGTLQEERYPRPGVEAKALQVNTFTKCRLKCLNL